MAPDEVAARARACVGARFRLHGRDPATGLDCVGLAAWALDIAPVPAGYPLRGGAAEAVIARIDAMGLRRDPRGPLLLLVPGPFQHHLAIRTETGFIHADAGLRRVVEVPGLPRWPCLAAWSAG